MSLLNKTSLYRTVDNVNEAIFYGKQISKKEAGDIVKWVSGTLDTEYSYNKSFGVTRKDMKDRVFTFTGEPLNSPASMRHIMAEESCRVLLELSKITGRDVAALSRSNVNFYRMLEASHAAGKHPGTFCCGPCTVGLWRHLSAGGLPDYAENLDEGISVLHDFHDGAGRWGRFPFFYTLLALSEIDLPIAQKEINYAQPECERILNRLHNKNKFSIRKRDLLLRVMN